MAIGDESLTKLSDCRYGRMMYLKGDKYIGPSLELYGEYCQSEAEVFGQLLGPGQVAVEIGANIGAHTIRLSQLVGPRGKVFAFEPQRVIFQILCANIALNEAFNVHTIHAASGHAAVMAKVPYIDYGSRDSNFGGVSLIDVVYGEDVNVIPLDNLVLPSLRLLKIDVEGMELRVLLGAQEQIARHRPVLYVENDRRSNSPELIKTIQAMGYDLWWHFARLFNPNNYHKEEKNIFSNVTSINLLCISNDDQHSITGFQKVTGPDDWWEN